jgi:N-formylglutamate amidohydrolase
MLVAHDKIWHEDTTADAQRIPLLACAIHDGHGARDEVERLFALGERERLREEDPFTGTWTSVAPTRVTGLATRFQVDLNRPRDRAVYLTPEDAWGLTVWKERPSDDVVARSLSEYDAFYGAVERLLGSYAEGFGRFVVFDIHSYNHRRDGPGGPIAPPDGNPQVNIGTGTMDRSRWAPVVDRFMRELRAYPFPGGPLDVRENVKFKGGNFPRWIHETFPENACALAIEFKKVFMDEWTGEPDRELIEAIRQALTSTVDPVMEELSRL